jgi:ribokinase
MFEMSAPENITEQIRGSLPNLPAKGTVSVLPDYFVDRFVKVDSIDDLISAIKTKSQVAGGGSIRGVRQAEVKGGNAVNMAYALGKFGARVNLLTIAQSLAAETLASTFRKMPNVTVDIVPGRNGFTIALEFVENGRHVNVMVSDTGDLERFDGELISEESWRKIAKSTIVAVVNWSANKMGTELCSKSFALAKENRASTFFDPADLAELAHNIPSLVKMVFERGLVDYVSLNDNELRIMCKVLSNHSLSQDYTQEELKVAARLVSEKIYARVDVHTKNLSISCKSSDCTSVPCHRVNQKIVTGAGDVWDSADIIGLLLNWEPELRLRFANAAAGLYVSGENAEPPSTDDVLDFLAGNREYYY